MRNPLLLFIITAILLIVPASANDTAPEDFSRTRHRAALLALLCYNPFPPGNAAGNKIYTLNRFQTIALCQSFVQEGGYDPARTAAILDISDPEVEYAALLIRELEGRKEDMPRPGALMLAGTVAMGYSRPSIDGMRAAIHAGRMSSADPDLAPVVRAAYSMVVYALEGALESKEELINVAAVNADEETLGQEIRSLRIREWRKLPPETTLAGRFCRAVHIFNRGNGWTETMRLGQRQLMYQESLQFLAVLCGAWYDLPRLPEDFVWGSLKEREVRDLCADLHKLASEGVLNPVSRSLIEQDPAGVASKSWELVNGVPVGAGNGAGGAQDAQEMLTTGLPVVPVAPAMPQNPAAPGQPRIPDVHIDGAPRIAPTPLTAPPPVIPAMPEHTTAPSRPDAEPVEIPALAPLGYGLYPVE